MPEKLQHRRWFRWLRDILLFLVVLFAIQWWQTRDVVSGPAPSLTGPSLQGQTLSLQDYRGKPVLVHFWATWCPVCRLEDGSIDSMADDLPVLTVATTSGAPQEVRDYLDKEGLNMPVLLDGSGELAREWGVQGVPATFIVDADGQIDYATVGYSSELGLRVRMWLAR